MSDVVSSPEIYSQQLELLPDRILFQIGTLGNVIGNLGGDGGGAITGGDAVGGASGDSKGPAAGGSALDAVLGLGG